ncbi:MAG TPA: endospore germination permease [Bacillus bacterium]|nr:endospore germination permease [Bacillus sp. (in: firmicutes)]
MLKSDKVSPLHIILLLVTASGIKTHVFCISPLLTTSGRDAWITVLITIGLFLFWLPFLIYIHKKTNNRSLYSLLSEILGMKITYFINFIIIIFIALEIAVSLRETITWTTIAYLPETPQILVSLILIILCWFLASSNFGTINTINVFLLFFIVIFGFFVSIANIQYKNFSLLFPVLEHGYGSVFEGIIYPAAGYTELFFFLLLQHKVHNRLRFRHFFITLIILGALTFGPLVGSIIEFGPIEATKQRFPPYEQWGLVSIGRFIEHVDFLSIYQWLSGIFIRISLLLFIIKESLQIKNNRIKNIILFFLSIVIGGIIMVPITDFQFTYILKAYILPVSFWFLFCFSILFTIVAIIYSRQKGGKSNGV